jgi:predicted MFS family arabinose efflux permease
MLAALSTLVGVADVLGTVSMGALINWSSSTEALAVCLVVAGVAAVVCSVWPNRTTA